MTSADGSLTCSVCRFSNLPTAQFCERCGTPLRVVAGPESDEATQINLPRPAPPPSSDSATLPPRPPAAEDSPTLRRPRLVPEGEAPEPPTLPPIPAERAASQPPALSPEPLPAPSALANQTPASASPPPRPRRRTGLWLLLGLGILTLCVVGVGAGLVLAGIGPFGTAQNPTATAALPTTDTRPIVNPATPSAPLSPTAVTGGATTTPPTASPSPAATATTPPAPTATPINLGQIYRNPVGGYVLSYPPGWQLVVPQGNTVQLVKDGSAGTVSVSLLYVADLPDNVKDSAALWQSWLPQLRNNLTNLQFQAVGQAATLAGQPAYGANVTWTADATPLRAKLIVLAYNGRGYLLQLAAPVASFDRELPDMERIASTVQLEG